MASKIERLDRATVQTLKVNFSNREANTGDNKPNHAANQAAIQRRRKLVSRVHRLGARVIYELLNEIGRHNRIADDIDRRLERSAGLDADVLAALGADRFPASPIRKVPQ